MTQHEYDTLITALEQILESSERHKNAYFMRAIPYANARRAYERKWSVPSVAWTEGGHSYTAAYTVTCTCTTIRACGHYTRDGEDTTLTAVRNSYNRML